MISAIRNKIKGLPSWVLWGGLLLVGILIIIFNDALGDDDSFIVISLIYFVLATAVTVRWLFLQLKMILALKRDKAKMEMLHLKSQVNPHFFFNTLNNLYGLVAKDPKQAQELILKLSEMMRYSIYDGQKEWVTLEEEVTYLSNYVELHRSRYHKKVNIDFRTSTDKVGYRIMPLLLILLVENAFKHGVEKLRNDAYVNINLAAKYDQIEFSITNNYDQEDQDEQTAGIGISNLKRRLEIGYKRDYDLKITKEVDIYTAELLLYKV